MCSYRPFAMRADKRALAPLFSARRDDRQSGVKAQTGRRHRAGTWPPLRPHYYQTKQGWSGRPSAAI